MRTPYNPPNGNSLVFGLTDTSYTPPAGDVLDFKLYNPTYFNVKSSIRLKYGILNGGGLGIRYGLRIRLPYHNGIRYKLRDRWEVDYDYFMPDYYQADCQVNGHIKAWNVPSLYPLLTILSKLYDTPYGINPTINAYQYHYFPIDLSVTGKTYNAGAYDVLGHYESGKEIEQGYDLSVYGWIYNINTGEACGHTEANNYIELTNNLDIIGKSANNIYNIEDHTEAIKDYVAAYDLQGIVGVAQYIVFYNILKGSVYKNFTLDCPLEVAGICHDITYSISYAVPVSTYKEYRNVFGETIASLAVIRSGLEPEKVIKSYTANYDIMNTWLKFIITEDDL